MRKIAVAISKGGVGKTTTAVHLAYGLARRYRVLLIDTDHQGQCSKLLGVNPEYGLANVLDGQRALAEAIVEARPNLHLLAGSQELSGVTRLITRQEIGSEHFLSERLEGWDRAYDFAILDTSPSWDALSINVLFYADEVLSPISTELLSVDGFTSFRQRIDGMARYKQVPIRYVLPTSLDGRVRRSGEVATALAEAVGGALCESIRYSSRIAELAAFGEVIWESAPKDRAAVDYAKLVRRVIDDGET